MSFASKFNQLADEGVARKAAKAARPKKECFAGITIKGDTISHKDGNGPILGAVATVDAAGEVDRRITATRLMLAGPLALAMRKKKDHRELYLTVAGTGFSFVVEVEPKDGLEARQYAARINTLSSAVA